MNLAIKAIAHVLRRVQQDPDLAWHMVGTESLALCMQAIAEHQQREADEVRSEIESAIVAMQKQKLSRVEEQQNTILQLNNTLALIVNRPEIFADDEDDDPQCESSLEDLLQYCRLRNERPTIEAVEAAMRGRKLAHCLQQLEYSA